MALRSKRHANAAGIRSQRPLSPPPRYEHLEQNHRGYQVLSDYMPHPDSAATCARSRPASDQRCTTQRHRSVRMKQERVVLPLCGITAAISSVWFNGTRQRQLFCGSAVGREHPPSERTRLQPSQPIPRPNKTPVLLSTRGGSGKCEKV
jgi:hypothetical protein